MATERKTDEILLNALVDGELSPSEHAAAAARLRNDRDFARAYATLTKLKAFVAEMAEKSDVPPITVKRPDPRRRWIAYAAAACLALVLGTATWFAVLSPTASPVSQSTAPQADVVPVAFIGDPVIPDLSSAGLQLARTVVSASTGVQSLVATYLGPRGCRLELWVSNESAEVRSRGATDRRSWRVGSLVYELVAFGMPAERFGRVAALAERETRATKLREGEPLIQARIPRPPCVT